MNAKNIPARRHIPIFLFTVLCCLLSPLVAPAATMNDYCVRPPFISAPVPPMVMFDVGRDHKLYFAAYNDGVDLNSDGKIDITYDHSIEYYGYFNPYKCYTHTGGSTSNDYFTPVATNTDRFCSAGQWGGSILNWLTMSRMDIVRKVMYGGQRSQESPKVLLNRAYIPQDAHSWGKEYTGKLCSNGTTYNKMCGTDSDCDTGYTCQDKSVNLVGIAAPTPGTPCAVAPGYATKSSDAGYHRMLVVEYPNTQGNNDTDHDTLLAGFDTTQFYSGFTPTFVTDFSNTILDPTQDHGDNYAQMVVAEFSTGGKCSNNCTDKNQGGDWQFAIDGDDGVELEIRKTSDGNILPAKDGSSQLGWYGGTVGHAASGGQTHSNTWTLANSTKYLVIVRHMEASGQDGVRLWYKTPVSSGWHIFGESGIMDVFAPNIITSGASVNTCSLRNTDFLDTGMPSTATALTGQGYHLFCNTTLASGVPTSAAATQTTLLRMIKNSTHRIWQWSLKERPVCDDLFEDDSSAATNRTDYTVKVEVCKPGIGTLSEKNLFERCRNYGGTYDAASGTYSGGTWMPIGLFQKYGEYNPNDPSGITRVCSKTMGKACSTDNDCDTGEGLCFDNSQMYFGAMTTTYTNNLSGGVLRKNPGPVSDEVNMNNGTQQTSENTRGNLIHSMDRMVVIDYDYGSHSYSNCGWIGDRPINEGECRMWGNPIAELMYESIRFFAGKGAPTEDFTYSSSADSGVNLSKPDWGYTNGSITYQPFDIYPSCAQPFILLLSDVNTSYDGDQIPGSSYAKPDGTFFTEDNLNPHLQLGDIQTNGKSLLNSLMDTISATEAIGGHSWFVGESGGATDFICSPKSAVNLQSLRGTCPEEPTKKGSYYAAAIAYYGKTQFGPITGHSPVSTFVVAMSSPYTDIKIRAGSNLVGIVPVGKSVSGTYIDKCLGYGGCTFTTDSSGNFKFSNCPSTSYCPTNGLVGLFINDVKYNASNEIIYMKFRQNFEDMEQGADYDMDAIGTYEVCTQAAATAGYGSCANFTLGANDLEVYLTSSYASGSVDQVLGYIISGTTADGTYLVVRDKDVGSGSLIAGLPLESKITFTSSGTSSANFLKNPLWYAAKWGGFTGSGVPDTPSKWDKDNDGNPDNYFPVSNPLQLDQQLDKALNEILARVASGTAASILNNSEGTGANLLQAVFYPKKQFDESTEASWIGEMQNLWYYVDPRLNNSSIREDTNQDNILNLKQDYISKFYFDAGQSKTLVQRFADNNGDGIADSSTPVDTISPDDVNSLWKAGRLLWQRNLTTSPRTIYTHTGNSSFDDGTTGLATFTSSSAGLTGDTTFRGYLQVADATEAAKLMNYVNGTDQAGYRPRKVTISGCGLTDLAPADSCTREWRLGDIVSSTPKLVSTVKLNTYDLAAPYGYSDTSYSSFTQTPTYLHRGMVLVGGNDGMMHAFNLGVLKERTERYNKAEMDNASGSLAGPGDQLGKEMWSFIPKNALPYLRYLTCVQGGGDSTYCGNTDYGHIFLVDRSPTVADASIVTPTVTTSCTDVTDYSTCDRLPDGSTWTTVVIGGMGFGASNRLSTDTCVTGANGTCIKTPIATYGLSSYFALDVKDPANPKYMWEFNGDPANNNFLRFHNHGTSHCQGKFSRWRDQKWQMVCGVCFRPYRTH